VVAYWVLCAICKLQGYYEAKERLFLHGLADDGILRDVERFDRMMV